MRTTALGVAGLMMVGGGSAAVAVGGGGGGAPGSGTGSSGAFQVYNMQYDAYTVAGGTIPSQGYMAASTDWFINNYAGPGAGDTSMGTGARDQIRTACTSALARAEARGGNKGLSRVVAVMWAGSSTSPWASSSSASATFFNERWTNDVVGAGFPGIYTAASPFLEAFWPEALAEGGATPSAVCIALNQNEPPTFTTDPPVKTLAKSDGTALPDDNVLAAGQQYQARIQASANGHTGEMSIWDTIQTDKVWIGGTSADDRSKVYVLDPDGRRVAGAVVTVTRAAGRVTVSASVNVPDGYARGTYTLVVPTYVLPTKTDYTIKDGSYVTYDGGGRIDGNEEQTRKVTPAPDKVWVLDEAGALTAADPGHTNTQGADEKVFLPGEAVSAVVNGKVPGKLSENLSNYAITDDWTKAAQYVDFSDVARAKVFYETAPGSKRYTDVSSQFDVKVTGTQTTATAKAAFLNQTKGQAGDRAVKLVISGEFRTDYETNGATVVLHNAGSETWNTETINTNEPPVFTWTPDPNKQVLGSGVEGGDHVHESINGMLVFPGQWLEYSIRVDLRIPGGLAHGVKSLAVEDRYDPLFLPVKSSVQFWDSRDAANPKPVPRSAYTLTWDDAAHSWTATFTDTWLKANLDAGSQWLTKGWLTARFHGVVSKNAKPGSTVKNQAFEILNGARVSTEIPEVKIPEVKPDKEDLSTDLINIDGKGVVKGDTILYRLLLDASVKPEELAYRVHKLGMTDDYDEKFLKLLQGDPRLQIVNTTTGENVTAKFNLQDKGGIFYAFAKQVDSVGPNGNTIKGDPQPTDLGAYAKAAIDPAKTPIIDQALMGHQYWITLPMLVTRDQDGYVIKNQAVQNLENINQQTRIVSNPLKKISPDKDVTVEAGGKKSINGTEVGLNKSFNYRLNTSLVPGNMAYETKQWSITDTFDRVHDQYTGKWAVYANADVYDGEKLVAKKGDLLQDSDGKGVGTDLFTATFDEKSYTLKIEAMQAYFDLVNSRPELPRAWSAYTQMVRIKAGSKIVNTFSESYNGEKRPSNEVWTKTPEPVKPAAKKVPPKPEPVSPALPVTGSGSLVAFGIGGGLLLAGGVAAVAWGQARKRRLDAAEAAPYGVAE